MSIKLEDLRPTLSFITGRNESLFNEDLVNNRQALKEAIAGANVLIIGAAGSIGGAFTQELLNFEPSRVCVMDVNENGLTELVRNLRSTDGQFIPDEFITYPVNFSDPVAAKIIAARGPFDIVANFAAHKHVRSEKDMFSIEAMFENNVFRAADLLDTLAINSPKHFFCVSTDKAANPANLMGASKKLMEKLLLAYTEAMPVSTARFANVAFSNGSLPDGFLHRLRRGQPLSAPADVRRYFVTHKESGQICLLSCILGKTGDIFFPRLSETDDMRTFADIARNLLESIGMQAVECETETEARAMAANLKQDSARYPVYFFSSDTAGEKPYEEFFTEFETTDLARFKSLGVVAGERQDLDQIKHLISQLRARFAQTSTTKDELVRELSTVIDGFDYRASDKNLDQKM